MSTEMSQNWTEQQKKYMAFVARGKTDLNGNSKTDEQFAEAMGVDRKTLWRWKMSDGFMQEVFDLIMREMVSDLPMMTKAVKAKVIGQEMTAKDKSGRVRKLKPADTQAFLALMRQASLLKSDKVDHTTNGKDLPQPIVMLDTKDE